MSLRFNFFALLIACAAVLSAQEVESAFKIAPAARVMLDGAAYGGNDAGLFQPGMAISDVSLGARFTADKWFVRIDVGYAFEKVGLKDVYFQYNISDADFLRAGTFFHPYGLQSSTSPSMKCTMENPTANAVFANPRQIGVMYEHSACHWLSAISFHVEQSALVLTSNQMGKEGYGLLTRQAWRPAHENGKVVQLGISGGFSTPQYNAEEQLNHRSITLGATFPSRVSSVKAVSATVDNALNLFKFTPELLINVGPAAFEAQYYFTQINRRNGLKPFVGQGAYAMARCLLFGGDYEYAMATGNIKTPKPKSLECVLCFNYADLCDSELGISGGRFNDTSATFNYFINRWMICRLRFSYSHRWDSAVGPAVNLFAAQARLQISF